MNLAFPKIVHALALLAMVVTSCGRGSYNSQLVQVDSLLNATDRTRRDNDARKARRIFDRYNKNIKEYTF